MTLRFDGTSRRVRWRRRALLVSILGSALLWLTGCPKSTQLPSPTTGADCMAEPVGKVAAWLPDPEGSGLVRFSGTVTSVTTTDTIGKIAVHSSDGRDRVISYQLAGGLSLPLSQGAEYTFQVEHAGRFPATSALVIWDARGMLFTGVSDLQPGATVLSDGLEGFAAQLLPATCDSRPHSDCYAALRNRPLEIFHQGKSVTLRNGGVGTLGGYVVRCLTAQEAQLSDRCADAGVIGVSYTLTRK